MKKKERKKKPGRHEHSGFALVFVKLGMEGLPQIKKNKPSAKRHFIAVYSHGYLCLSCKTRLNF